MAISKQNSLVTFFNSTFCFDFSINFKMADYQDNYMSPRIDYNSSKNPMSEMESALEIDFLEEEFSPKKIGPGKWLDCPTFL